MTNPVDKPAAVDVLWGHVGCSTPGNLLQFVVSCEILIEEQKTNKEQDIDKALPVFGGQ